MSPGDIDDVAQFVDLGLDSITAVTWVRKIKAQYQISIEAIKVYSCPTLAKFSLYVLEEIEKRQPAVGRNDVGNAAGARTSSPTPQPARKGALAEKKRKTLNSWRRQSTPRSRSHEAQSLNSDPIAVIGMAGQFPDADDLDRYWQNLAQGKNCIHEIPKSRWDKDLYYQDKAAVPGKTNCKWMGALEHYDRFDPLFFDISPLEALSMDPQQRLFLQTCWHTLENAGYTPKSLAGSKTGVFVGCGPGDYHLLARELQISALGFTGGDTSILAARVSYLFDLQGPCLTIETACSSSLVAMATACDSLVSGNSDMAIAGGVYISTGPELHIKTAQTGMLSEGGRCFTFDQRANGFVPGEGVGAVLLKRLSDAERDQDTIIGVIQGWGVNQDGKTNGITAPNPDSQTRLQQTVYDKYGIDPAAIQLIEAHGTGTKLGDPIEVDALKQSFDKYTHKKDYCALGSVKSNIGHCFTAAGIASTIKVLLSLKNKQLPPTINYESLNEHIDLKDSPFYVNTHLQDWDLKGADKRQAAISGFGFGGTNAHVVVSEYEGAKARKASVLPITENGKLVIPLSAKTDEQLQQKARDLFDFICNEQPPAALTDLAYTLQVSREAMEQRLGILADSLEELAEKLRSYIYGEKNVKDVYLGSVKDNKEGLSVIRQDDEMRETIINNWISQTKLSKLLNLWVKGLEFDWHRLYGVDKPKRMSVPLYPFAKERYWIADKKISQPSSGGLEKQAVLHPLVHTNISDLNGQRFASTFSGNEFFLNDHQVAMAADCGQSIRKTLPGVAYLEMARAAVQNSLPELAQSGVMELHHTVWIEPIVVDDNQPVEIALYPCGTGEHPNDVVEYEIYTRKDGRELLHCKGQALFDAQPAPAKIALDTLKSSMRQGQFMPDDIYKTLIRAGLHYGPAHQGISALYRGQDQVLAHLRLPASLESGRSEYLLHPSLLDSALQASIGFVDNLSSFGGRAMLPFALENLRIISPCTSEMYAWLRYSTDGNRGGGFVKYDVDLIDHHGNICVQMLGFSTRELDAGTGAVSYQHTAAHQANDESAPFDYEFYENVIERLLDSDISVEDAVGLG